MTCGVALGMQQVVWTLASLDQATVMIEKLAHHCDADGQRRVHLRRRWGLRAVSEDRVVAFHTALGLKVCGREGVGEIRCIAIWTDAVLIAPHLPGRRGSRGMSSRTA